MFSFHVHISPSRGLFIYEMLKTIIDTPPFGRYVLLLLRSQAAVQILSLSLVI